MNIVPAIATTAALVSSFLYGKMASARLEQGEPPQTAQPATTKAQEPRFDRPETYSWVRWNSIADYAQTFSVDEVESISLHGEEMGCFSPREGITITDRQVIQAMKKGLENAQCPSVPFGSIGQNNALVFHLKPGKKPSQERAAVFAFHPWWPAESFGPQFYEALRTYSRYYVTDMREKLMHTNPATVESITFADERTNHDDTDLTKQSAIARLLHTARSLNAAVYDVTNKKRLSVHLILKQKGKPEQTFYLLMPDEKARGAFAETVYHYVK